MTPDFKLLVADMTDSSQTQSYEIGLGFNKEKGISVVTKDGFGISGSFFLSGETTFEAEEFEIVVPSEHKGKTDFVRIGSAKKTVGGLHCSMPISAVVTNSLFIKPKKEINE